MCEILIYKVDYKKKDKITQLNAYLELWVIVLLLQSINALVVRVPPPRLIVAKYNLKYRNNPVCFVSLGQNSSVCLSFF